MRRRALLLLVCLGVIASWFACSRYFPWATRESRLTETFDLRPFFDHAWATSPLWDDGQAEVATYSARRLQYGKLREFDAVFITVKEDFDQKFHVKAEAPYEGKQLLPVLKLNMVQSYATEFYPYHFLTSVFISRAEPTHLVKLTQASQEWCGNTFKEVKAWSQSAALDYHSYWDSQGDGSYPLGQHVGALLEDQLPVTLRALRFQPGLRFRTRILPTLISNRAIPGVWVDAEFAVAGQESVATPAGQIPSWKVVMKTAAGETLYWFEKASPNILVKFAAPDGREFLLKARERRVYWPTPK